MQKDVGSNGVNKSFCGQAYSSVQTSFRGQSKKKNRKGQDNHKLSAKKENIHNYATQKSYKSELTPAFCESEVKPSLLKKTCS